MNWSATVLTATSSDTEPSIIFAFESGRYIFNAGEGTNRAFVQGKHNWKKMKGLFFTDMSVKRVGGVAGLLMTLADAAIANLNLVGPPGLTHLLASMRLYTFRDSLHVVPIESSWTQASSTSPQPLFKDKNISVYGIPVLPGQALRQSTSLEERTSTLAEGSRTGSKRKRSPSLDTPEKQPSLATDFHSSVAAIFESSVAASGPSSAENDRAWRKILIDRMFAGPPIEENTDGNQNKRKKEKKPHVNKPFGLKTPQTEPSKEPAKPIRRNRGSLPPGFFDQVPKFHRYVPPEPLEPSLSPTLAYVIVGPRVRGKFDATKAEELGVHGRLRAQLTRGETVVVNVGVGNQTTTRTVRPEDVLGESEAPGVALVLDIPTPEHIPSLVSSFENSFFSRFRSRQPEDIKEYSVRVIFHICGKGVAEDPRYLAFMNGFSPNVYHIISSREHSPNPVTYTSAAFNQLRLNQLDPEIFPIPKFSLTPERSLRAIPNLPGNARMMVPNQFLRLRPYAPLQELSYEETGDRFHPSVSPGNSPPLGPRTFDLFTVAKKQVEECVQSRKIEPPKGADVRIVPLGTASAVPTKYRNVSSTLIQIPGHGNVLLDAGEGTWGQLARQFGIDGTGSVWDILRDMKCIFASHIHGDHHMGLAQILAKRRELDPPPAQPLYLVSVRSVHLYLREFSDLQDLGFDDPSGNGVISVMSEALHWKDPTCYPPTGMWQVGGREPWLEITQSQRNAADMCRSLGLHSFKTVDMMHRIRCFGAVLKHSDGWSLTFSADTGPANSLVYAGQNSTVLIHEATMDNDQAEMAAQKAHSTFGQALEAGEKMNAQHILLTHFSARYPKMPPYGVTAVSQVVDEETRRKKPIVALAFDNANLSIGNLWKVNYYLRAIEECMRDTAAEEEEEEEEVVQTMEVDIVDESS